MAWQTLAEGRPRVAASLMVAAMCAVCLLQAEHEQPAEHALMQAQHNTMGSILAVSPPLGPMHGQHKITISGSHLCNGAPNDIAQVTVKGVKVHKVLSVSQDSITVLTGSLLESKKTSLPGAGDVLIVSHSRGATLGRRLYEYKAAPLIYSVSPDNGPHKGGTVVAIKGKHLCKASGDKVSVSICGQPASKVSCKGHNLIRATTSPRRGHNAALPPCDVKVYSKVYGHGLAPRVYKYQPAPVILSVSPSEGRYGGGNEIRISGPGLTAGQTRPSEKVTVKIGGKKATVIGYTPNAIMAKVPAGLKMTGFAAIEVESAHHGVSKAAALYRIHTQPQINGLHPSHGRADGGETLSLVGTHLGRGDIESVRIGGHKATVLSADARGKKIRIVTPKFDRADEGRTHEVEVWSYLYGRATVPGFKVHKRGEITSVSPRWGPASGGTALTIRGTNLFNSASTDLRLIKVNGVPATVVKATPKMVVARTGAAPAGTSGEVKIYSLTHGITASQPAMSFRHSRAPQITRVRPSQVPQEGGTLVALEGQRLCNVECYDLSHIQIGNARVTKFVAKSPNRIVFKAPAAIEAGGKGAKTIQVHSNSHGSAVVSHADIPLSGGARVTIEGPNLGTGESYRVLLAGVEAKVLSASARKIVVQAGDGRAFAKVNGLSADQGLRGNVVIETLSGKGKARGMDTQIFFQYNPTCNMRKVQTMMGPADGETTLMIEGSHLGMGDETILVDGKVVDSGVTVRQRSGSNVEMLAIRSEGLEAMPKEVVIKSSRTGVCTWRDGKMIA